MPSIQAGRLVAAGRNTIILVLAMAWVSGLFAVTRFLLSYEKTPGTKSIAPENWPKGVAETGQAGWPTLVVTLHPRCSCSRASTTELERASQQFHTPFNALLLVYQPKVHGKQQTASRPEERGTDHGVNGWRNDDLYRDLQREMHAQMVPDIDGAFAASFGAKTSGEVLLYSPHDSLGQRHLLYAGGVTGARGMSGPNAGADALVRAFQEETQQAGWPVFGCGLLSIHTHQDKSDTARFTISAAAVRGTGAAMPEGMKR